MVDLAGMRGRVMLVNLWATWCAPCRGEIPALAAFHERYSERGLRVVGISVDSDLTSADLRVFVMAEKIPYLILHDTADRASLLFTGQQMLPASFLFDRGGVLSWSRIGAIRRNDPELSMAIETALDRSADGTSDGPDRQ